MDAQDSSSLRWTLGSALVGGTLFFGISVFRVLASRASPLEHIGPMGAIGVIGFTVGGLVGPLAHGLSSRFRGGGDGGGGLDPDAPLDVP